MKKLLGILLCMIMVMTCACGGATSEDDTVRDKKNNTVNSVDEPDDNQIVGADWRTFKPYGIAKRVIDGMEEDIYIETFPESGIVRLLEDSSSYNIIQEIETMHEMIYDQNYLEENVEFSEVNGDGIVDLIIPDKIGEEIIGEVYLYDVESKMYVYSELDSINMATLLNGFEDGPDVYTMYHWEYEDVVTAQAIMNPDNKYFLYDVNGDNEPELVIQTSEGDEYEIYYPLYDGGTLVGAMSAGIVPGSEDGIFAYDENGICLMNRYIQGARYVYEVSVFEGEVVTNEIYAAEEKEYAFDGTEFVLTEVTDMTGLEY